MKKQFKLLSILSVLVLTLAVCGVVKALPIQSKDGWTPISFLTPEDCDIADYYFSSSSFASTEYVYGENSNLYIPVNDYVSVLENELGMTVLASGLLDYNIAIEPGFNCSSSNFTCKDGYSWIGSTSYWLGNKGGAATIFRIKSGTPTFGALNACNSTDYGVRPVITIATSDIQI